MKKSILYTPTFEKELKKLSKNYKSIKTDFAVLLEELNKNDTLGVSLGNNVFKIRMKITDKNKGKSAGARIITFYKNENNIYLLSIYDKSEKDSITKTKINDILNEIQ